MKKLSVSVFALAAIVIAVASSFTTKSNFATTIYKILKVSPSAQPSGSQQTDAAWYNANHVGMVEEQEDLAFTETELNSFQGISCDPDTKICLVELKFQDDAVVTSYSPRIRNGALKP